VAEAAVATFRTTTLGTDRTVTATGPSEPIEVVVDREAMVDALVNLLSNAHKYSPAETPIVLSSSGDARVVRWSVTDEGIGIPRAEHRRIFQKFYRVDERLSRAVEGTGLGLAIVQHIALGHGGRVEVVSEPGQGSTFSLVVPRPAEREQPARAREASRPVTGEAAGDPDEHDEKLDG
jgi:two-component system phosphate regulon sensor histidine kinase PhoR